MKLANLELVNTWKDKDNPFSPRYIKILNKGIAVIDSNKPIELKTKKQTLKYSSSNDVRNMSMDSNHSNNVLKRPNDLLTLLEEKEKEIQLLREEIAHLEAKLTHVDLIRFHSSESLDGFSGVLEQKIRKINLIRTDLKEGEISSEEALPELRKLYSILGLTWMAEDIRNRGFKMPKKSDKRYFTEYLVAIDQYEADIISYDELEYFWIEK
jgi:vacuolar-type H+-ATPase subunit I/STV1